MHIRIKRKNTALFLYVDPSETVGDVKEKIETLLDQPAAKQKLFHDERELKEDHRKLSELNIGYDEELFLVYQLEGSDAWEEPDYSFHTPPVISAVKAV